MNLNLKSIGEYKVFYNDVFAGVNVKASALFAYDWNDAGDTITVTAKSAEDIAATTGVKHETATAVVTLANSKDATAQQIGQVLGEALAEGKADYVEAESKKMNPGDTPVTHSVATTVQNQVVNLTSNRMANAMPVMRGRAGGDITSVGYGAWAQGLINKTK